jgi:hypothetical protein
MPAIVIVMIQSIQIEWLYWQESKVTKGPLMREPVARMERKKTRSSPNVNYFSHALEFNPVLLRSTEAIHSNVQ